MCAAETDDDHPFPLPSNLFSDSLPPASASVTIVSLLAHVAASTRNDDLSFLFSWVPNSARGKTPP